MRNLISTLWFDRFKRPTRAVFRLLMPPDESPILFGPLRGKSFRASRYVRLGIHERSVETLLVDYLKPGNVFYDIGANVGYFSLLAAELCGPEGHVYAIDPTPNNIKIIRHNLDTNGISHYTLIEKAVSNQSGSGKLTVLDGTKAYLATGDDDAAIPIEMIALDDLSRQQRPPNVVKIDVEGAESRVIEGATETLKRAPGLTLIIEVHDEANDQRVRALLQDADYQITSVEAINQRRTSRYPYHIIAKHTSSNHA